MDSRLLKTPCTILAVTSGAVDEYGNPTDVETSRTTRCHIEQDQSFESDAGSLEQTVWRVWLPADAVLDGVDSLQISGQRYNLTGDPWPVIRPTTGLVDHLELRAKRTR
jgi:hypothetical protein